MNDGAKRIAEERQSEGAAIVNVPAGSQWPSEMKSRMQEEGGCQRSY